MNGYPSENDSFQLNMVSLTRSGIELQPPAPQPVAVTTRQTKSPFDIAMGETMTNRYHIFDLSSDHDYQGQFSTAPV